MSGANSNSKNTGDRLLTDWAEEIKIVLHETGPAWKTLASECPYKSLDEFDVYFHRAFAVKIEREEFDSNIVLRTAQRWIQETSPDVRQKFETLLKEDSAFKDNYTSFRAKYPKAGSLTSNTISTLGFTGWGWPTDTKEAMESAGFSCNKQDCSAISFPDPESDPQNIQWIEGTIVFTTPRHLAVVANGTNPAYPNVQKGYLLQAGRFPDNR